MGCSVRASVGLVLFAFTLASAEARTWKDATGLYTIEADLIGFEGKTVVLQRENGELGSFPIEKLSAADREFLKSKEALKIHSDNLGANQTWTLKSGLKVIGKINDYVRRDLTIQRRGGKVYVNDKLLSDLPVLYQKMLPQVIQHFGAISNANKGAFDLWVRSLGSNAKTFKLDGVLLELEVGGEYVVPFFLFTDEEQKWLSSGWNTWLQANGEKPADPNVNPNLAPDQSYAQDDHSLHLQAMAAMYQQNQENQQANRQIAIMNLNMQAIQSGLTSAWEVTLYPEPGNPYPPRWVVVLGRNSLIATENALRQNPGFTPGPVRKVSY